MCLPFLSYTNVGQCARAAMLVNVVFLCLDFMCICVFLFSVTYKILGEIILNICINSKNLLLYSSRYDDGFRRAVCSMSDCKSRGHKFKLQLGHVTCMKSNCEIQSTLVISNSKGLTEIL